jgi:hypothetical protein
MNKYTELLEKHVQWVALAIGGIWLLFMVYKYVLVADSSTVEIGGQPQSANRIDQFIRDTKAYPLRDKLNQPGKLPDKVEEYEKRIVEQLAIPIPDQFKDTYVRLPVGTVPGGPTGITPPPPPPKPIVALPDLAAPENIDFTMGRSTIALQAPPGVLPANPAGGGGAVNGVPTLVPWVTVAATVPMKKLGEEFNKKITSPLPVLHQTTLLKVEMERQELLPNGQWSKSVAIPSINFGAMANPIPAWPAGNDRALQMQFATAVAPAQPAIAEPTFYTIVKGDVWHAPGQTVPVAPGANPAPPPEAPPVVAPPTTPRPTIPGGGTRPPPVRPPSGPPRRGGGERGDATPKLPAGTVAYAQVFNEPPPPTMTTPGAPGMPGAGQQTAVPAAPPANQPGQVPTAQFDPANANEFPIWVHDVTAEPGKTYRYHLRYTMKSPVFGANAACNPQNLGNTFALVSPWTDWTKPVSIPNTTIFFAVNAPKLVNEVKYVEFAVFTWTVNGLVPSTVKAVPGDMIDDKIKISVVDIRDGGNNIILMDENGTITSKSVDADKSSPEYKAAVKEASQPVSPVAGG